MVSKKKRGTQKGGLKKKAENEWVSARTTVLVKVGANQTTEKQRVDQRPGQWRGEGVEKGGGEPSLIRPEGQG